MRATFWLSSAALVLGASATAHAHEVGTSILDLEMRGSQVFAKFGMHAHLVDLVVGADQDGDGALTADELASASGALTDYLGQHLTVRADETLCPATLVSATPTRRGGGDVVLQFTCEAAPRTLAVENRVFFERAADHVFLGTLTDGDRSLQLRFDAAHPSLRYETHAPPELTTASTGALIWQYLRLGVDHILGGIDHLLFVLTLILVARRLRDLATLITSFTLAHSVTLTLGALDVVVLPPSFVEPAIAVTILAVAIQNLWTRGAKAHNAWLVFAFGLLHGFGFAGALAETGLPTEKVGWALGAFNVGVELGQLTVVALAWPLLRLVATRRASWYGGLVPVASAAVAVLAVVWFIERVGAI